MSVRRIALLVLAVASGVGVLLLVGVGARKEPAPSTGGDANTVPILAIDGAPLPTTCDGLKVDRWNVAPAAVAQHEDGTTASVAGADSDDPSLTSLRRSGDEVVTRDRGGDRQLVVRVAGGPADLRAERARAIADAASITAKPDLPALAVDWPAGFSESFRGVVVLVGAQATVVMGPNGAGTERELSPPTEATQVGWTYLTEEARALGFSMESAEHSAQDDDAAAVAIRELDGWLVGMSSNESGMTADRLRTMLASARFTAVTCPSTAPGTSAP